MSKDRIPETVKMATVAAAVARHLPGSWAPGQHDGSDRYGILVRSDGAEVWVEAAYPQNGAVHISTCLPQSLRSFYRAGDSPPTINVAYKRGAEAIAKEIVRRLLPGLEALMEKVRARAIEITSAADNVQHLAREVVATWPEAFRNHKLGALGPTDTEAGLRFYGDLPDGDFCYGDLRVSSYKGGSVTMDLRSIPAHAAVAALKALREAIEKGEEFR